MIRARHVRDEGGNYEAVVLVDDDGFSFSIQRALEFDEQDRVAGMDTYCLVADAGATHYGGVESWRRIEPGVVLLDLTEEAADALGVPGELELDFDPPELDRIDPPVRRLIA